MRPIPSVRISLVAVTMLATFLAAVVVFSEDEAGASCVQGDESRGVSLFCIEPTTTTTTTIRPSTTTTLEGTTTTTGRETTTTAETTTTFVTTTTLPQVATTTTIPTKVLPTVITTSTLPSEVSDVEALPFTGYSNGSLWTVAISLITAGALAVYGARRSRSEN